MPSSMNLGACPKWREKTVKVAAEQLGGKQAGLHMPGPVDGRVIYGSWGWLFLLSS